MDEELKDILRAVDDAGKNLSPVEWLDFLQSLHSDIDARLEGARCDLENEDED